MLNYITLQRGTQIFANYAVHFLLAALPPTLVRMNKNAELQLNDTCSVVIYGTADWKMTEKNDGLALKHHLLNPRCFYLRDNCKI